MTPRTEALADWLVAIYYPFDIRTLPEPPITRDALAEAWHRHDPSATVEEWRWSIDTEIDTPLAATPPAASQGGEE